MPIKGVSEKRVIDATKALRLGLDGQPIVDTSVRRDEPDFHLSHTQLSMILRCPKQYEFRYVKGLIRPPSGALVVGKAFHKGAEGDYSRRKETGQGIPQEELLDSYSDAFDKANEGEVDWGEEEPGQVKDEGATLLTNYAAEISPTVEPAMVEHFGEFRIGGIRMKVVIDVVDAHHKAIDMKVTGRRWSDASNEMQHFPYLWYLSKLTSGLKPWDMSFEYHVNNRSAARNVMAGKAAEMVQLLPAVFNRMGFGIYYQQLRGACKQIEAGIFPPRTNASGNFLCSEKWCGYWPLCVGRGRTIVQA